LLATKKPCRGITGSAGNLLQCGVSATCQLFENERKSFWLPSTMEPYESYSQRVSVAGLSHGRGPDDCAGSRGFSFIGTINP